MNKKIIFTMIATSMLSACSDSSSLHYGSNGEQSSPQNACLETGTYACKTGETEPLYPFQWALNYKDSFFKTFKDIWKDDSDKNDYGLNVENVHKQGIKGQGINVLVLDDGIDISHEDLAPNIDKNMLFNFLEDNNDPTPANIPENIMATHGTNAAGIIAAAQNGKGVMGIAPKVNLGGANYMEVESIIEATIESYGGGDFSKNADIINASYGSNPIIPVPYGTDIDTLIPLRALTNLRQNKGALFIKASGNEFSGIAQDNRTCPSQFNGILSCENPAHDIETLEPNAIVVTAANSRGIKSSYSNAGAINWVTGLGGEFGFGGTFGEGNDVLPLNQRGPTIFSTDLQGCDRGYSKSNSTYSLFMQGVSTYKELKNNVMCNYSYMNGTSAAAPTISGVVALILQANPNLTWRDVREILSKTSRAIDQNYDSRVMTNHLVDLATGEILKQTGNRNDIKDGAIQVPLELGWQTNNAGYKYSNWYGFGLVDATAAVNLAKKYKADTLKASLPSTNFEQAFPDLHALTYGKVTHLGNITINQSQIIDQFQLRVSGSVCIGSVGFFVKSPSGVVSSLSTPYNIHYNSAISEVEHYGLGSYAFYGEQSTGQWEIYAVSGNQGSCESSVTATTPLKIEYRILPKLYS